MLAAPTSQPSARQLLWTMLLALAAMPGCKTRNGGVAASGVSESGTLAQSDCVAYEAIDFETDDIEFQRLEGEGDTCSAAPSGGPVAAARFLVNGRPVCSEGLMLGDERVLLGARWYTAFKWPKDDEALPDSAAERYKLLEREMLSYSKLVGTCLSRPPEGAGEVEWADEGKRWVGRGAVYRTAVETGDPKKWCGAIRRYFVESFVKPGSTYCQYGNCSEGGRVGACLALHYGFTPTQVRLCSSGNDHRFALVDDTVEPANRSCILDRWDLVGHYRCGVDVDRALRQVVTRNGASWSPTNQKWFKDIDCQTIADYVRDPASSPIPQ